MKKKEMKGLRGYTGVLLHKPKTSSPIHETMRVGMIDQLLNWSISQEPGVRRLASVVLHIKHTAEDTMIRKQQTSSNHDVELQEIISSIETLDTIYPTIRKQLLSVHSQSRKGFLKKQKRCKYLVKIAIPSEEPRPCPPRQDTQIRFSRNMFIEVAKQTLSNIHSMKHILLRRRDKIISQQDKNVPELGANELKPDLPDRADNPQKLRKVKCILISRRAIQPYEILSHLKNIPTEISQFCNEEEHDQVLLVAPQVNELQPMSTNNEQFIEAHPEDEAFFRYSNHEPSQGFKSQGDLRILGELWMNPLTNIKTNTPPRVILENIEIVENAHEILTTLSRAKISYN